MVSNKLDLELSADAQRIIADARGFDDPTSEDRHRVKARWLASIAIAASVSSLSDTARAATGASWALKGTGLALAIAAGVAGVYLLLPGAEAPSLQANAGVPSASPLSTEQPPEEDTTPVILPQRELGAPLQASKPELALDEPLAITGPAAPAMPSLVALPAFVTDTTPRPRRPKAKAVSTPARAPEVELLADATLPGSSKDQPVPAATSSQLSEEIGLLSQIRRSVREGAGARALDLLTVYRDRFEQPILGMEASALSVDALCQTGQREAARAAAERFRNSWPASPLGQRVSAACP